MVNSLYYLEIAQQTVKIFKALGKNTSAFGSDMISDLQNAANVVAARLPNIILYHFPVMHPPKATYAYINWNSFQDGYQLNKITHKGQN